MTSNAGAGPTCSPLNSAVRVVTIACASSAVIALGLPGGNIFHAPLSWPFAEDDAPLDTPARRWGVATEHPRILLCGAGAQRGGGVSGLGGHNAAMAVLESD